MTPQSTRPYIKQEPINDSPTFRHLNSLTNIPISHFTAVNPANENPKDPRINKLSHRLSSLHLSPTEKWLQTENERLKNELMHVKIQLASARWKLKQGVAGVQGNRFLEDTQVKENAGKELKGLARMEKRILNRERGGIETRMKDLEIRGGSGENKAGEGKMRVEKVPEAAKLSERTVRIKAERPSEKSLEALKGSAKTALGRVQTGTSFLDNVIEVMKGYCRVQGQCFYVKREDIQDFKSFARTLKNLWGMDLYYDCIVFNGRSIREWNRRVEYITWKNILPDLVRISIIWERHRDYRLECDSW